MTRIDSATGEDIVVDPTTRNDIGPIGRMPSQRRRRGRPVGSAVTPAQLRIRTARNAYGRAEEAERIQKKALGKLNDALDAGTAVAPGVAEAIALTGTVIAHADRTVLECSKQLRGTPDDAGGAEGPGGPTPDAILKELTQGKKS